MQSITPFLWFDASAEEAMNTYVSIFKDSEIGNVSRQGEGGPAFMVTARLAGLDIMALNGGSEFSFTPSFSFYVECESEAEIDATWEVLVDGGSVLMPLDAYPFAEKYGWLGDRFGLSWQLILTRETQSVTPFLMFVGDQFGRAEEAIRFYTSILPDSGVDVIAHYEEGQPDAGKVVHARFHIGGQSIIAMESGLEHNFTFTEANSLFVTCDSQEEVDDFWRKLTADGGEPGQCGWLKDRFGVSWQIVPSRLMELMGDEDPEKAGRVTQAMLQMTKIEIPVLEAAYAGAVPA